MNLWRFCLFDWAGNRRRSMRWELRRIQEWTQCCAGPSRGCCSRSEDENSVILVFCHRCDNLDKAQVVLNTPSSNSLLPKRRKMLSSFIMGSAFCETNVTWLLTSFAHIVSNYSAFRFQSDLFARLHHFVYHFDQTALLLLSSSARSAAVGLQWWVNIRASNNSILYICSCWSESTSRS